MLKEVLGQSPTDTAGAAAYDQDRLLLNRCGRHGLCVSKSQMRGEEYDMSSGQKEHSSECKKGPYILQFVGPAA